MHSQQQQARITQSPATPSSSSQQARTRQSHPTTPVLSLWRSRSFDGRRCCPASRDVSHLCLARSSSSLLLC
ncbi:uncharacterized protein DS421_15g497840 [Arachis hypogaea]|nr:uncharacterized protein DS421_15g497840 [Arachis hypogaea]